MAEGTASLTFVDLKVEVADYLGYGRTESSWGSSSASRVDSCVQSGYRQFLAAGPAPSVPLGFEWSFMKPTTTLATVAATYSYTLPDNHVGIFGPLTFEPDKGYIGVEHVSEARIRQLRQLGDSSTSPSGRPVYYGIQPIAGTETTGQRFKLILYPTPDAAYTLTYRFVEAQNVLTDTYKYPLGGQLHSETILASCLAIAELRYMDGEQVWQSKYTERLIASVNMDSRLFRAENLGVMRDNSESSIIRDRGSNTLSINGTSIW